MNLHPGVLLDDRYALRERLGQGGQGSVWKAFDKNTGTDRALKIIRLPEGDREAAERARREAHLLKDARHPALVTVHSLFEIPSGGVLVLVFDFVQAAPLADSLKDERFGRAHRLAALRHLAAALSFLHGKGIVHRDLKPDNVLVTPVFWDDPAAPSSLKLIDFGIAAPRRGPDGATLSGMFGTPPYMAPELFAVTDLDTQRSPARDVFAFGVIGWELLDGKHPTGLPTGASAGAYSAAYLYQRRSRDPWPPHVLPGRWGSVIAACLALDPASRPADGRAILAALEDQLNTPSASAAGLTPPAPAEAGDAARPQPVTDPHDAPRVSTSDHASGAARPFTPPPGGSREPAAPSPRRPERTEIAPPSSLPKSTAVDRTTPMPPSIAAVTGSPPPRAPQPMDTAQSPAPPADRPAPAAFAPLESPEKGTWQALVIGLLLVLLFAAGTAWLLLYKGVVGGQEAPPPPVPSALPPPAARSVPVSAQSASPAPAAGAPPAETSAGLRVPERTASAPSFL